MFLSYVGMFNNPAMQNMMQQMMSNPELMQNMMSSPFMEATLSQMRSNPDLANQLLANNPLFASNPQMAEQMRQNLPDMIQRVSSDWLLSLNNLIVGLYYDL